jgi:hypothetical protein
MTKPTKDIKDFFSAIRVLLTHGLLDKHEIITWADNEILKTDQPDDYLIDLSLMGSKTKNEIYEFVDKLAQYSKTLTAGRALVGLIADKINDRLIDYKKGFEILYCVQRDFNLTELEKNYINHSDDELELAINQVWGDKDEVQDRLKAFLKCYDGFTLDNADSWGELSNEINFKLAHWDKKLV